ncbi:MAG: FkbM family methyltransferase [Calothrix sp. MO_192.B10]|nr:FkbM family methyltransferase [Calothrix sp. MO_192.B10]
MSFFSKAATKIIYSANPASNRNNLLWRKLNQLAITYHKAYENLNYDTSTNGENFVVRCLADSGLLKTVFDVGANSGGYASTVREHSPNAEIYCFEPVPEIFAMLSKNRSEANTHCFNIGLGEETKSAEIAVTEGRGGTSSLMIEKTIKAKRPHHIQMVSVIRGDEFLETHSEIEEISLLKIDTEGYEPQVLRGFGTALEKIPVIQFEYGKASIYSKYLLMDYFRDYNSRFRIGKIYPNGVQFYVDYNWNLEDFIGPNYLMVNRDCPRVYEMLKA